MNRREFSSLMAGAAAAALLPSAAFAKQSEAYSAVSPQAAELYRGALVLDCNSAPPGDPTQLPLPHSDLDMVRNSGINVVKLSLGGINADFVETISEIAIVERLIELHPNYFMQVRVAGDLERAKREGKLGIISSFESADMFEGKVERIELFRNLGVRVMQLSYNRKSPFAGRENECRRRCDRPESRESANYQRRNRGLVKARHHDARGLCGNPSPPTQQNRRANEGPGSQGRSDGYLRSSLSHRLA
jgi:hypothetical protein